MVHRTLIIFSGHGTRTFIEEIIRDASNTVLSDTEADRWETLICNMVGYNMEELSVDYLNDVTGCEVVEVDFPSGGFSDASHVFFRIEGKNNHHQPRIHLCTGIHNAIKAILKVHDMGMQMQVRFRQSNDHFEKLRNVSVFGNSSELKDQEKNEWKKTIRRELERYGDIAEVAIFRKGFISVTFKYIKHAAAFEVKNIKFYCKGTTLTASRTSFPILVLPDDVVVDGFYTHDKDDVIRSIISEGGSFYRIHFSKQMSKMVAAVSFVNFEDAVKLVNKDRISFTRSGSKVEVTLCISWTKDYNMKKEKRDDEDSTASKNQSNNNNFAALESRFISMERRLEDDRKAAAAELVRLNKERQSERKDDEVMMIRLVTDVQRRIASALAHTVAEVMDKQTVVHQLTMAISDLRSEKIALTTQISIFTGDPKRQQAIEALIQDRAEVCGKIAVYEVEMRKALAQRVELPLIEDPTEAILKLQELDNSNGKVNNGKSKRKPPVVVSLAAIPHPSSLELYEAALAADPENLVCFYNSHKHNYQFKTLLILSLFLTA